MNNKEKAKIKINEIIELVKKVKKTGRCGEKTLDELEAKLCSIYNFGFCDGLNEGREDMEIENQETL